MLDVSPLFTISSRKNYDLIMKTIAILLMFITLSSCKDRYLNTSLKNNLDSYGLKDKVKSIKTTSYMPVLNNNEIEIGEQIDKGSLFSFSKLGYVIKLSEHDLSRNYNREIEYIYDKKGKILKMDNGYEIYEFYYNEIDSIIKVYSSIPKSKNNSKIIFEYGNKGKKIKRNVYIRDTIFSTNEYSYNKNNKEIKNIQYDRNRHVVYEIKKEYDERKHLIKKIKKYYSSSQSPQDSIITEIISYKYDNSNNVIEVIVNPSDYNYREVERRKYYKNDILKEQKVKFNHIDLNKFYNEKGDLIMSYSLSKKNDTLDYIEYDYLYDSHSNWIKKIIKENEKPKEIVVRKIEYYQ